MVFTRSVEINGEPVVVVESTLVTVRVAITIQVQCKSDVEDVQALVKALTDWHPVKRYCHDRRKHFLLRNVQIGFVTLAGLIG